jgi:ribulose-5-phosphate 4-epimerase/fuculose-1-phosphate aldolase
MKMNAASDAELTKKLSDAVWIARSLFDRGKASGSTANLSFLHNSRVYITGTGSCFGRLSEGDFSVLDMAGQHRGGPPPSKECPLHLLLYGKDSTIHAVIHTHSFYSTLWSCRGANGTEDAIPAYTPYLGMKVGKIGWVPYAPPGTEELFALFANALDERRGYLLRNHGPILGGADLMSAFCGIEELEESARIAWELRNESGAIHQKI